MPCPANCVRVPFFFFSARARLVRSAMLVKVDISRARAALKLVRERLLAPNGSISHNNT